MRLFKNAGWLVVFWVCSSQAPAQEKPQYLRVQCVKVADGKFAEFDAILPENRKLAKVRVDSGLATLSLVARFSPDGSSLDLLPPWAGDSPTMSPH